MKQGIEGFSFILLLLFGIVGMLYVGRVSWELLLNPDSSLAHEIKQFATWTIGIPVAALGSFALVIALPTATKQKLEITGPGGFKFAGPACEIAFWIASFLSIIAAIKLLQDPTNTNPQGQTKPSEEKSAPK